ncbi:hypothetical protein HMPREF9248_0569 [Fannyhessea vaginae PB189-T1-4]|uniref:Uncharacterized protein n=1 Tax=Fannyhessea vaginae PB189-T1-4 TaxID=866774 RepID=A0ABP2IXV4_9ACTN|nr:hypothetical protein HMPREF9248_0569 [Fannyhessea vaginae PB189-T1-4]
MPFEAHLNAAKNRPNAPTWENTKPTFLCFAAARQNGGETRVKVG